MIFRKCLRKSEFQREKNLPSDKEPLVECKVCGKTFHAICAQHVVFNDEESNEKTQELTNYYVCEQCEVGIGSESYHFSCLDIPETPLSRFLEFRITKLLGAAGGKTRRIRVRILSSSRHLFELRPSVQDFMNKMNISGAFPYE